MPPTPQFLKLTPIEAVEYFRSKVNIPTEQWDQFSAEQHDFAYTVAGLTRADLLEAMRFLIDQAIAEGTSFETFLEQFDRSVVRRARETEAKLPVKLRTVFETPVRRAYGAGRFKQMRSSTVMRLRPFWIWRHRDSVVPRPNHLALHNKVFPGDSEFWDIAMPMCAFGCKCGAFSLSDRQVKERGLRVEQPPDPNTIADPGFRRAPGSSPQEERQQVLRDGLERLSPEMRSQVEQDMRDRGLA